LVLQDLPEVIVNAHVDEKVTTMAHDFFLPQPVKGEKKEIECSWRLRLCGMTKSYSYQ
jgi:hypothetical protein